ncbi:putative Ig domain-containing protein [Occallatibacter riparius]|uniref:Ig domain-containing protein n=1 Tax=Occallatibacter riparius TaxID=1002689 RepID=A0A9J7BNS5_9BACT|nr:putative Ig domain-containing protein [Occallatibacter riparius]UWZ83402.1 putative Ig domain-containing protein [Occallatibacter riparius]
MSKALKLVVSTLVLAFVGWSATANAATEAEKLAAIQNGLAHLAAIQQSDGSWGYFGVYEQAATGAAAFSFLSQQANWGSNASAYQTVVDNAMAFLLANASTMPVNTRNDGVNICPGGAATCTGVYWYGAGESTYTTGLIAPAIALYGAAKGANNVATTAGPLANMTWADIAQGLTNEFSASQSSAINGNRDGGWRYYIPGNGDSDSSTTQWAVLTLLYDQTLGAVTPQTVVDHLKNWLVVSQVAGYGGAGCYQPDYPICEESDTGSLLIGLKFTGADINNAQVQAALAWLNSDWTSTANSTWYGNFGHPYAMWAVYKGLETNIGLNDTTHLLSRYTDCGVGRSAPPGDGVCTWWQDYNEYLVTTQNPGGDWSGYSEWVDPLSTAFFVNILGATQLPQITAPCLVINAIQGTAITPATMQATGGAGGPYTYTATGLPAGLTMSTGGTISGTPTVNGTFPYTVTITDKAGNTGTVTCSILVYAPISAPCTLINAKQGTAITPVTVVATGGAGGYTFTAAGLPNGISISSSGTISGTPTVSGTFPYTITITDSAGNQGIVTCSITVAPAVYKCPLSHGYWKNHSKWPVSSLTLGNQTYTQPQLVALLRTPVAGDASLILAYQLIAAKLNIANGSDPTQALATIVNADALLSGFTGNLPYHVKPSSTAGAAMTSDAALLDAYNNAMLTPGCVQ